MVILAWTGDELSRGQARNYHTHRQTQATTIPEGQNWPQVIKLHRFDTVASLSTNGSAAFIWKHRRHWLKGLWQHYVAVAIHAPGLFMSIVYEHIYIRVAQRAYTYKYCRHFATGWPPIFRWSRQTLIDTVMGIISRGPSWKKYR